MIYRFGVHHGDKQKIYVQDLTRNVTQLSEDLAKEKETTAQLTNDLEAERALVQKIEGNQCLVVYRCPHD